MSISLSDLVARLAIDVPAQDGYPAASQYEDAVHDAVHALNDRYTAKRLHEFATVSNQADYALPADFLGVIQFSPLVSDGNVLITASGLVPVPLFGFAEEEITISGETLTIHPTPTYALTRQLWYKAGHVLDGSDAYPTMTARIASIVSIKAQANAWRLVCGKVSRGKAWKYQIGDVMIDKTNVGKALKEWVSDYDGEFDDRIKSLIGHAGGLG
jgi:hypothetical protein